MSEEPWKFFGNTADIIQFRCPSYSGLEYVRVIFLLCPYLRG